MLLERRVFLVLGGGQGDSRCTEEADPISKQDLAASSSIVQIPSMQLKERVFYSLFPHYRYYHYYHYYYYLKNKILLSMAAFFRFLRCDGKLYFTLSGALWKPDSKDLPGHYSQAQTTKCHVLSDNCEQYL